MSSFLGNLLSTNVYKNSQGRVARRCTAIGVALVFALGAYSAWSEKAFGSCTGWVAAAIVAVGLWVAFRVINYPTFADFLSSVEAEMAKVSWPTKKELFANTKVVLIFMFLFTVLIFAYDLVFTFIFSFMK
ncbi:MAG: preprotein translocase subunit SecE [Thermoguttaceae bacterium]|nr:preprotein translocase subunit SecE [Thermoguttaceae bacterium]